MTEPPRDPLREALERIAAIDAAIEARKAGGTEPVMAMMVGAYPVFRAALAAPEPLPAEPSGTAIAAAANTRSLRERGVRVDEWVGGIQSQAAYERAVGCDVRAAYAVDRGATDSGGPLTGPYIALDSATLDSGIDWWGVYCHGDGFFFGTRVEALAVCNALNGLAGNAGEPTT